MKLRQAAAEELYTAAPWESESAAAVPTDELVELLVETPWSDGLDLVKDRAGKVVELLDGVFVA